MSVGNLGLGAGPPMPKKRFGGPPAPKTPFQALSEKYKMVTQMLQIEETKGSDNKPFYRCSVTLEGLYGNVGLAGELFSRQ